MGTRVVQRGSNAIAGEHLPVRLRYSNVHCINLLLKQAKAKTMSMVALHGLDYANIL